MAGSKSRHPLAEFFEENWWWLLMFGLPALGGLLGYLEKWNSTDIILLLAILSGTGIIASAVFFWHRVRLAQANAALKEAMLRRDLTPGDIERLLMANSTPTEPPRTDEQAIEELTECLAKCLVPEASITQILKALREAEPPMRQTLCSAVVGLVRGSGGFATKEKIMAVVRGLTRCTE